MSESLVSLVERLRVQKPLIGTLLTIRSADVAEALAIAGFDWFMLDLEHSTLDVVAAQQIVQAVAGRAYCVLRLPDHSPEHFKKCLDTGCDGIIVPLVNSKQMAENAVRLARYPPLGARSVGIGRAHGYGLSFGDYVAQANERVALILQVEHIDAVNQVDEILRVPGFDAVLIGPYDLSGSMNRLGEVTSPQVVEAIDRVKKACLRVGKPFGIFRMTAGQAKKEVESGVRLTLIGTDMALMTDSAKTLLDEMKPKG
ncbi:MAG TPA: aldolase/citrate lyase family protein [Terracidiphilus sp.]|nr:aldolase/citrate lyase family protein [Terracidiphilus sp.]